MKTKRVAYTPEELEAYFNDPEYRHGKRPSRNRQLRQALIVVGTLASLLLLTVAGLGLYFYSLSDELPPFELLENPRVDLSTVAYTADGRELARYHRQNRTWVSLDQISPYVVQALVATEDHRFYKHWGIDLFRTMTIPYHLLRGRRQGSSTITMQLARNLYAQIGFEPSIKRKLKEMMTAVQLERNYTKDEILEMYLNTVTFGYNAYGIEMAARTYFNKSAAQLDILESATLVGMLKGTTRYNPVRNPERSMQRRNVVLAQMVKHGYLSRETYEQLKDQPTRLNLQPIASSYYIAPYFAEQVRLKLQRWGAENGYNIYTDGLQVYTPLDARLQEIADSVVQKHMNALQTVVNVDWSLNSSGPLGTTYEAYETYVKKHPDYEPFAAFWKNNPDLLRTFIKESRRYRRLVASGVDTTEAFLQLYNDPIFLDSLKTAKTRLEVGFVAIDPSNGHIKVWIGGRDFKKDKYDHVAIARRQPGSTFKPFVYTAAIDNGYSPYYRLPDDTLRIIDPYTGQVWSPENFGQITGRMVPLREGLSRSLNTITARLVYEIGPQRVVQYARQMGIKSPLNPVYSIALGTSEVTLLEMVAAYATLASGGIYHEPMMILRIEDRYGSPLSVFQPTAREALSPNTAYTILDMMRDVLSPGGTGVRLRTLFGITHDLAGKTGTTQRSADGWFMLIHPRLVMGAWVGFNDPRVTFRNNYWGQGAHNALHIVADFFKQVYARYPEVLPDIPFEVPPGYVPPEAPQQLDIESRRTGHEIQW